MPRGKPRASNPELYGEQPVTTDPKKAYEPPTQEQIDAVKKAMEERTNARLERMNAIADGADEARDPDMQEFDGDKAIIRDDAEEREAAARRADEEAERAKAEFEAQQLQTEGAEEVSAPIDAPPDYKLVNGVPHYLQIVNGQERWMSLTEIRAAASKVESADEYLRIAKESARNLSTESVPSRDEPTQLSKDELRSTLSAVALGDEGAIDRLASTLEHLSHRDDTRQIDQRIGFQTELAAARAEQREVMEHPLLGDLFAARFDRLKREAPTTNLTVAFRKVGDEIRKQFPNEFQKTPNAVSLTDKAARKRTLPAPVNSAGRQVAEQSEEEELTVEQEIAQIAKARGQARPVVHARGFVTNFAKQAPDKH